MESDNRLSVVVVTLLRGLIARDQQESLWQDLVNLESSVRDYIAVLGLDLVIVEDEGYAFLQQAPSDADAPPLPRLMARRPLSYPVSLLLALLRRKLAEHDTADGGPRLVMDTADMVDALRTFLPDGKTEARVTDQVVAHLRKVADLGFIHFLNGDPRKFEVHRLLKAFIDAQWLQELEQRLRAYAEKAEAEAEDAPQ